MKSVNKTNLSSIGTIPMSLLAASCCIGPAIFVVFGASVGFLGKLTFFAPIQPYLLGVAFIMLGYSFWMLYLKKSDCECKADLGARKIARGIFWVGFILLVFASTFQKVVLWLYS